MEILLNQRYNRTSYEIYSFRTMSIERNPPDMGCSSANANANANRASKTRH